MDLKIKLLGTGTSSGVPVIGCKCEVCTSTDPHDNRLRCSALVDIEGKRILIDCGPDFRQQILPEKFVPLDAVLLTHEHYDHVGGLDDLRPFKVFGSVHILGEKDCLEHIRQRMPYCFGENVYPGVPALKLCSIKPFQAVRIGNVDVLPIRVMHGQMPILGFRIGPLVYITDMKTLPSESEPYLQGCKVMIVNGLRFDSHPTHQSISEAVDFIQRMNVPEAYLTHLAHSAGLHSNSEKFLSPHIHFAYDGQVLEVSNN